MNNSKLVELYRNLSIVEKKSFQHYIGSSFINTDKPIIALNVLLANALVSNQEKIPTRKEVYKVLFGNEKFNDKKLGYLMTILTGHLETFIAQLKIDKTTLIRDEYLLIELKERSLDKHFIGQARRYQKELENKKKQDADHYYRKYVLERELDDYFMKKEIRGDNKSLQLKSDNLELFFLSEKLKSLCEMINRKNIIGVDYNLSMSDEIISYVRKNSNRFSTIPAVNIYYRILMCLLEEDIPGHFEDLKIALKAHYHQFSKEEARNMYDYAQNYCIKKLNSGKLEYVEELFLIFETLLFSELIFDKNQLSQWDYKNIVSVSLKLGKFDWTKDFIEKYKSRISPEFRENAYEYNLAYFYYTKKDYKNAIKLLQKVEFTDVYYHLNGKAMLLNLYYELENIESFYSLIDAYKVYLIRTKKISVYQRQVHQIQIKYTKQAFDLKLRSDTISTMIKEKAIRKLKERINANKAKADFTWLLERINEL